MKSQIKIKNGLGMLKYKHYSFVLIKQGENYILSQKKHFYPINLARILGNSLKKHESPKKSALRQLKDIISTDSDFFKNEDLQYVANLKTIVNTAKGETIVNSYIYYARIPSNWNIQTKDNLCTLCYLKESNFQELILSMSELKENLQKNEVLFGFNWQDYIKVYQPIHQIALDYARKSEEVYFDKY